MPRRKTTKEFIRQAIEVHGSRYDYNQVEYINSNTKVSIGCPIHGWFTQAPVVHLIGSGCQKCGIEKVRYNKLKFDSLEESKQIIKDAIKVCGSFPTHNDVIKYGLWDANRVILKLGGFATARVKFGFDLLEKPKGFWAKIENVKSELEHHFPLLIENHQCPTLQMMSDVGVSLSAACNHHGGLKGICNKLNLIPAVGFRTRDGHYVRSYWELILDEYLYSRKIPHEPEIKPFPNKGFRCDQKCGEYYIELWGMPHNSKDYVERRKEKEGLYKGYGLNLVPLEKKTFIQSWSQIESSLDEIFAKCGFGISKDVSFDPNDIALAVAYPWNEDAVIQCIQSYIKEYNDFPTQTKLKSRRMSGLANRIYQFGGFKHFRELMGYSQWVKPNRKWSEKKIISRLKELCQKLGRFPKDQELASDLRNAIRKCSYVDSHDLNWYREKLDYNITKKSNGYWAEGVVEQELHVLIVESGGVFPTNSYLRKIGRYDLAFAIQKSGGFNRWRQKLGFPIIQNSPNQYNDADLTDWFEECVEKFGQIPTVDQLKSIDSRKQSAIARRGGMYKFACRLAEKNDSFATQLDDYKSRNGINGKMTAR